MENKIIELVQYNKANEAEMLVSLLKSEGIECYVRDGINSIIIGEFDGAKVDILEKDLQRALEIMEGYNYEIPKKFRDRIIPEDTEQDDDVYNNAATDYNIEEDYAEYAKNKARTSKYMTIIIVLMIILLGILLFLNKYYTG